MNHDDHVRLIERGIDPGMGGVSPSGALRHLPRPGGVWADLGAGWGAFTLALRDVAGPETEIYAIDRDASSLRSLESAMDRQFPGTNLHLVTADFTRPLDLPPLDGIVAANSIHFVRDAAALLRQWRGYLKPTGRLIIVEYDSDDGNRWVPHPISFRSLPRVAHAAGFGNPTRLETTPSRFLGGMYGAKLVPNNEASGVRRQVADST